MNRWLLMVPALVLASCMSIRPASAVPPPASLPAGSFYSNLTAVVEQPKRGSVTLTLILWRAEDGRLGVNVKKLENDLAWVVVSQDRLAVWLPKSGVRYDGPATNVNLPPWLGRLDLLAAEVGDGPVPDGTMLVADGPDWAFVTGDARARLRTQPDGTPTAKVLTTAQGVIRLEYGKTRLFDGIPRPGTATTMLPDGTRLGVTLGSLRAQFPVPEKRLVLPAAAAQARPVDALGLCDALAALGD